MGYIFASILIIISTAVMLGGCEPRYRYECQDPANWGLAQCKEPACSSTKTCPEDLIGEEIVRGKIEAVMEQQGEEDQEVESQSKCTE